MKLIHTILFEQPYGCVCISRLGQFIVVFHLDPIRCNSGETPKFTVQGQASTRALHVPVHGKMPFSLYYTNFSILSYFNMLRKFLSLYDPGSEHCLTLNAINILKVMMRMKVLLYF